MIFFTLFIELGGTNYAALQPKPIAEKYQEWHICGHVNLELLNTKTVIICEIFLDKGEIM